MVRGEAKKFLYIIGIRNSGLPSQPLSPGRSIGLTGYQASGPANMASFSVFLAFFILSKKNKFIKDCLINLSLLNENGGLPFRLSFILLFILLFSTHQAVNPSRQFLLPARVSHMDNAQFFNVFQGLGIGTLVCGRRSIEAHNNPVHIRLTEGEVTIINQPPFSEKPHEES